MRIFRVTLLLFPLISSLVLALPPNVLKVVCLARIAVSFIALVLTGFTAAVASLSALRFPSAFLLLQLKTKSRQPAIKILMQLLNKLLFNVFLFIYFLIQ